jgi:hypothetical protein
MSSNFSTSSLPYNLLPSAFLFLELPIKCAVNLVFVPPYSKGKFACGYFMGMVALPIVVCGTPLTIVADMIMGIAEARRGKTEEERKSILFKKIVVSPLQQITFAVSALATATAIYLLAGKIAVFVAWLFPYVIGRIITYEIPKTINFSQFDIFNHFNNFQLPENFNDTYQSNLDKVARNLKENNFPGASEKYLSIKNKIRNRVPASKLFDLGENFTKKEVKKKYQQLSLLLHPDRNLGNEEEAKELFTCVTPAYEWLLKTASS